MHRLVHLILILLMSTGHISALSEKHYQGLFIPDHTAFAFSVLLCIQYAFPIPFYL